MQQLPPLTLERKLDSRIWGGDTLGAWMGLPDAPQQLAESWQVYEHNRVRGGPFDGQTLADLAREHGADLLGKPVFERWGASFPLLAKFLDAGDELSVQVHPDDEYAHTHEAASGFHGKTEAWYILQAAPGAAVIHGFRQSTDRHSFEQAVHDGTLLDLLRYVPVAAGDTIFVPAGTVHAINRGILLFEIQETSDLTYRVYDYDRRDASGKPRELHLERALDVSDYGAPPAAKQTPQPLGDGRSLLVSCPYFAMERWELGTPTEGTTGEDSFEILTAVDGHATLRWPGGDVDLARGASVVLPASLGSYRLVPQPQAALLRCYVPL